jgi:DNA-binding transcriptional LysR family regulator
LQSGFSLLLSKAGEKIQQSDTKTVFDSIELIGSRMELYQLRSFAAVSRTGNLTRAAQEMNISQSALSTQIRLLEEELGIVLFLRTARGMAITSDGSILLDAASRILAAADDLKARASELKTTLTGEIRIGLNTDPTFLRVRELNQVLARHLPRVTADFIATQTPGTPDLLRNRAIDVGFMYANDSPGEEIRLLPLASVTVRAVIPRNLAGAAPDGDLASLCRLPWIWTSSTCPFHTEFRKKMDRLGLVPRQAASAFDETIVRELVSAGVGIGLMREDEAMALEAQGLVSVWTREGVDLSLNLAWSGERTGERLLSAVSALIQGLWIRESSPGAGLLLDKCLNIG